MMKIVPLLAITSMMALLATGCNDANTEKTDATTQAVPAESTTLSAEATTSTDAQATAPKTEEATGASLHEANCTRCHGTEVYTREDRRVGSYEKLSAQVARCDANIGSQLFPEDLDKITQYLNDSFYKFDK